MTTTLTLMARAHYQHGADRWRTDGRPIIPFDELPAESQAREIEAMRAAVEAAIPHQFGDLPESVALAGEEAMGSDFPSYKAAHATLRAMLQAILAEHPQ